jgi:hypothetical protein
MTRRPTRAWLSATLVPGDHRAALAAEAERGSSAAGGAVEFQVAAAHAGGFDLQHDLAGPRRRVGELSQLDLAVAGKDHAFHLMLLRCHRPHSGPAFGPPEHKLRRTIQ